MNLDLINMFEESLGRMIDKIWKLIFYNLGYRLILVVFMLSS